MVNSCKFHTTDFKPDVLFLFGGRAEGRSEGIEPTNKATRGSLEDKKTRAWTSQSVKHQWYLSAISCPSWTGPDTTVIHHYTKPERNEPIGRGINQPNQWVCCLMILVSKKWRFPFRHGGTSSYFLHFMVGFSKKTIYFGVPPFMGTPKS